MLLYFYVVYSIEMLIDIDRDDLTNNAHIFPDLLNIGLHLLSAFVVGRKFEMCSLLGLG